MLNSISISTKTKVFVRSPGAFGDHHDSDSLTNKLISLRTNIEIPESSSTADPSTDLDISKIGTGINTSSLPTDLSTYNIYITTRLDIMIEVSCADRKFRIEKESGLVVLPSLWVGGSSQSVFGVLRSNVPPSYECALGYGEVGGSGTTTNNQNADVEKMDG